MNNPELYAKTNELPQRDAREFLAEYIPLVRWKQDGGVRVADIGCGTGDITTQILLPNLPESLQELVAIDTSPQMIQYAQSHHQHPRVNYNVLDITTKKLPQAYYEGFDQVFSLFCLHWVQDQRQAMTNIFNMLQPGGHVLMLYLAIHPVFEAILKLAELEHWKSYMPEPRRYVAVHQHVQNVDESLRSLLEEVGFKHITCHCKGNTHIYENLHTYTAAMTGVNPFIPQLPGHLKEKYEQELCSQIKNQVFTEGYAKNETDNVHIPYTLIKIHAVKPKRLL